MADDDEFGRFWTLLSTSPARSPDRQAYSSHVSSRCCYVCCQRRGAPLTRSWFTPGWIRRQSRGWKPWQLDWHRGAVRL